MTKLISKGICYILVLSLVSSMTVSAFAAETNDDGNSGITINGIYYTDAEFQELLTYIEPSENDTPIAAPRFAAAIPAWAIGQWVIPAIGTIIITPAVIKVGGKNIDSTSQTFSNILDAVKKAIEPKDKGDDGYKKPKSGSGKEKAIDVPSWAKGKRPKKNEDGKKFAKRLCNERYGPENMIKDLALNITKYKNGGIVGLSKSIKFAQ